MISVFAIILWICGYGHVASMCILACLLTNLILSVLEVIFKIFPSNPMLRSVFMNKILSGRAEIQDYVSHIFISVIAYSLGTLLFIQKIPVLYLCIFGLVWLILYFL